MNGNNLASVEKFVYNSDRTISMKTEIFFSNYDHSLNLLKGKFFINGAFYRAFSENNYNKVVVKNYSMDNNQLTLYSILGDSISYQVNSANIPDLFEYISK